MQLRPVPFDAAIDQYLNQASQLLEGHHSGEHDAIDVIHRKHPRFLDPNIPWLPRNVTADEIKNAPFDLADAQLTIARWYDFKDWEALTEYTAAVHQPGSPVFLFESAVEAVIAGDLPTLRSLLKSHPKLIAARSTRITPFDPPLHRATLLHYIAANGVENDRQRSPQNAVEITKVLLEAGAEPNALADMYGGHYATMSMLTSSTPPAQAGVQVGLVETLADFGAAVEALGSDKWGSPLMSALAFGFIDAAEALVRRGAKIDNVAATAGLGRTDLVATLLPTSNDEARHRAMALAAQLGQIETLKMLLDAGEDPNRYNPDGNHSHSTPLHQAALAGHADVVKLLVERGANVDAKDKSFHATPQGWANHSGQTEIEDYLRACR